MHHLAIALTQNTTLRLFYVSRNSCMTREGINPFCENPKSLHHLETFLFDNKKWNSSICIRKIASVMESNLTLSKISYMKLDRSERFYFDSNRIGRQFLYQDDNDLTKLWPYVLARVANNDMIYVMYFFVRERADMLLRSTVCS